MKTRPRVPREDCGWLRCVGSAPPAPPPPCGPSGHCRGWDTVPGGRGAVSPLRRGQVLESEPRWPLTTRTASLGVSPDPGGLWASAASLSHSGTATDVPSWSHLGKLGVAPAGAGTSPVLLRLEPRA